MGKVCIAAVVVAVLVAACAVQPTRVPRAEPQAPANFPESHYRQALAQGRPVYRIDPTLSLLVIEVRRSGTLARLGHDHVVASHDLRGYVAPDEGQADLYVQLDQLVVDEAALRAEAQFDSQPTEDDIAGTRRNMLKGLQAAQYPFAIIAVTRGNAEPGTTRLNVSIALNGMTREFSVPVQIEASAAEVGVTGRMALNQTDFGITPLSVLGGAIQVQDQVDLRFSFRARRIE